MSARTHTTGLLDIAPLAPEEVTIKRPGREDVVLYVSGLSALAIAELLFQFPQIRKMVVEQGADALNLPALAKLVPACLGAMVAAATGNAGSVQHMEIAKNLTPGEVADILTKCMNQTINPDQLGPFVGLITGYVNQAMAQAGPELMEKLRVMGEHQLKNEAQGKAN